MTIHMQIHDETVGTTRKQIGAYKDIDNENNTSMMPYLTLPINVFNRVSNEMIGHTRMKTLYEVP